jgi:hypothetical protein
VESVVPVTYVPKTANPSDPRYPRGGCEVVGSVSYAAGVS